MRFTIKSTFSTIVLLSVLSTPILSGPSRSFTSEDIFSLEYALDPQISPDGNRVAYLRQSMDIMTDSRHNSLWIINADGTNHRPIVSGKAHVSAVSWSPSGDRLAYVSGEEGTPQIYVRWMDSGQTAIISNLTKAPGGISWSPDGKTIAFTMDVPYTTPSLITPLKKPDGATWAKPFKEISHVHYRTNHVDLLADTRSHIFVIPATGGVAHQVSSGDFNHKAPLSWSKDSKTLYLSAKRNQKVGLQPRDSEIYALSVQDGGYNQLTRRKGPDQTPDVSPDGKLIVYAGYDDLSHAHHNANLYIMKTDGSGKRKISVNYDGSLSSPKWAADGKSLYLTYAERGVLKLGYLSVKGGNIREVASNLSGMGFNRPFFLPGGYSLSNNGKYASVFGTPTRPADIGVGSLRNSPTLLTELNEDLLGNRKLSQYHEITWKSSADNREIHGWYITPPNFDPNKKYPFILEIHGGPQMAWGPYFSPLLQDAAARGYVVLLPNPRGSTSYGAEFTDQIDRNYPGEDYDDLMSGVDALIDKGFIDKNQLFITGLSGGGILTTWSIGKTDRFVAAVARGPVINWTSESLNSTMNFPFILENWFDGAPWENPTQYWKFSPLSLVGNVKTPTMIMTGDSDYQTAISDSEQYFAALQYRGIETRFIRVPNAGHIFYRPSQMITELNYLFAWFERFRTK